MKRSLSSILIAAALFTLANNCCASVVFPFEIFSNNGNYNDNPGLNLYVVVDNGFEKADFTFYNASSFDCSIARIYFDDGSLLSTDYIQNGPGTLFDRVFPGPGNLPEGETLIPPFVANREFTIGADPPPSLNGVNAIPAGEWVKISFDLINDGTLDDVINELYTGKLRVGLHVISFPDGSSESAILVPEPASVLLFGLGLPLLLRRKKRR